MTFVDGSKLTKLETRSRTRSSAAWPPSLEGEVTTAPERIRVLQDRINAVQEMALDVAQRVRGALEGFLTSWFNWSRSLRAVSKEGD